MKKRFSPWPWLGLIMVTLLTYSVNAEEVPSLSKMIQDVEGAYYSKKRNLEEEAQELKKKLDGEGENPSAELLKQWSDFQVEAKRQELELQKMHKFIFDNVERIRTEPVAWDENYQKLHRFQYLENFLNVGDFWIKVGLDKYPDKEEMKNNWEKAKAEYIKEKEDLGKDEFVQAEEVTSKTHQKKDNDKAVVEIRGRAQLRALRKSSGKDGSVLDKVKQWRELSPEEREKIIGPR